MKLYNVIKQLIFEASSDEITNAIKNRNLVTIYYNGKDNGGKGLRVIEPFCYGTSKRGNKVIRAWEREGASYSAAKEGNVLPGWRLFRVDKILTFKPTMDNFTEMRPNYNPNGDKLMTRVIINAVFGNEEENLA